MNSDEIKRLREKIKELLDIKDLQELIKDNKSMGKDGIILQLEEEISELTKTILELERMGNKLMGKSIMLSLFLGSFEPDMEGNFMQIDIRKYDKFMVEYRKKCG